MSTPTTVPEPVAALAEQGVSVWLDDLSRDLVRSGELAALVARGVRGVTSNPTIFAAALAKGDAYDSQVRELVTGGTDVERAVTALTTTDVREACDVLAEGISVNVTLIFGLDRYRAVLNAWLDGLEQAAEEGRDVSQIVSVASFFVSRVDTLVDGRLDGIGADEAAALRGTAAVANARLAYRAYEEMLTSERWRDLAAAGARPQRPLWASTGVKDPRYPDTKYVVELVARDTVSTMPGSTLSAVADHGRVTGDTVTGAYEEAATTLDGIERLGVSYVDTVAELERQGVDKFVASWQDLLGTVSAALDEARGGAR